MILPHYYAIHLGGDNAEKNYQRRRVYYYMNKEFKKILEQELEFCKKLEKEQGGCKFKGGIKCNKCGAQDLLKKILTGKIEH